MQTWVLCSWWEKKKTKQKQLLLSAFVLVTFYLFSPSVLVPDHDKPSLLLTGVCSGCSSVLGPARCLQVASDGGQLSCTFPPGTFYDWRMRKFWDVWEMGKYACVGKEEAEKAQRMEPVYGGFCRLLAPDALLYWQGKYNSEKRWLLSGCPSWEGQKILKHGQSRRILSFPSHL